MNYATDMMSYGKIYILSSIKIDTYVQKLSGGGGRYTHADSKVIT
jgi:hypothetical protein